jgi:hypothetical protein
MEPNKQPDSMPAGESQNGGPHAAHKKAVLQKLMGNLLGKPGRSFHELSNGIKQAISTYKNYSKEWDTINGVDGSGGPGVVGSAARSGVGPAGIQKILQGIQQKKAMPPQAQGTPQAHMMPQQPAPVQPKTQLPMPPVPEKTMPVWQPPTPSMVTPETANQSKAINPPMNPIPKLPEISGPPQSSSFNRPAPVSRLGIHGF